MNNLRTLVSLRRSPVVPILGVILLSLSFSARCSSDSNSATVEEQRPGLLELETFLTNIGDPSGERYCKVTVKLAVVPKEKVAQIQEDPLLVARLRDYILTLLTNKSFLELSDTEGKAAFRDSIRSGANELIKGGEIREVLFSEFVVQ